MTLDDCTTNYLTNDKSDMSTAKFTTNYFVKNTFNTS